jgi:hypothetical protein
MGDRHRGFFRFNVDRRKIQRNLSVVIFWSTSNEIPVTSYYSPFQLSFNNRLRGAKRPTDKKRRDEILGALEKNGHIPAPVDDVCPTFSKKDYFVSFTDKLLIFMGLTLFAPLFNFSKETIQTLYSVDKFLLPLIFILMLGFFFYAQHEAKRFKQCTSCQIGNNIGVIIKRCIAGILLMMGAYFFLT